MSPEDGSVPGSTASRVLQFQGLLGEPHDPATLLLQELHWNRLPADPLDFAVGGIF